MYQILPKAGALTGLRYTPKKYRLIIGNIQKMCSACNLEKSRPPPLDAFSMLLRAVMALTIPLHPYRADGWPTFALEP